MTTDARELERLKALAFGRAATPEQAEAAADARRRLDALDGRGVPHADTPARGVDVPAAENAESPDSPAPVPASGSATPERRRSGSRIGTIVVGALCLALGIGIGATVGPGAERDAEAEPDALPVTQEPGYLGPPIEVPTGNSTAAMAFLNEPADEADTAVAAELAPLFQLELSSVRMLAQLGTRTVAAALSLSGELCLVDFDREAGTGGAGCSPAGSFSHGGLSLINDSGELWWDGISLTITP